MGHHDMTKPAGHSVTDHRSSNSPTNGERHPGRILTIRIGRQIVHDQSPPTRAATTLYRGIEPSAITQTKLGG